MYLTVKHLHITFVVITILFFLVRAFWSISASPLSRARWVRSLPHIIDTLLLACGIYLAIISQQYPIQQPWLTAKILGLLLYIVLGTFAIKRASTIRGKLIATGLAAVTFGYIVLVALNKSPWLF